MRMLMESQERKIKFVRLLQDLLDECDGVKKKLAEKLQISPSRLTHWLQGKIDPAGLEISAFYNIAQVKGCRIDELAELFDFPGIKQQPIDKFRILIKELLFDRTQEELGKIIGITQNSISNWLNPDIPLNPSKIPAPTMFALAREKGWSLERLLIYLDFESGKIEKDLFSKYRLELSVISLNEQIKILDWLCDVVESKIEKFSNFDRAKLNKTKPSDLTVCIILEKENIAESSRYTADSIVHLQLNPDNITIATIAKPPESIADVDLLIFDIKSADSPSIPMIEDISFEGDIVVFAPDSLPADVMANLSSRVTEVVVKPIDWQELKNKEYFR